jgi:hypothetical protein
VYLLRNRDTKWSFLKGIKGFFCILSEQKKELYLEEKEKKHIFAVVREFTNNCFTKKIRSNEKNVIHLSVGTDESGRLRTKRIHLHGQQCERADRSRDELSSSAGARRKLWQRQDPAFQR